MKIETQPKDFFVLKKLVTFSKAPLIIVTVRGTCLGQQELILETWWEEKVKPWGFQFREWLTFDLISIFSEMDSVSPWCAVS